VKYAHSKGGFMTLLHNSLQLNSRGELPKLIHGGIGIELGVRDGDFSAHLLEHSNLDLLVSLDCWSMKNFSEEPHFQRACEKLKPYGNRSVILKARFQDTVNLFPNVFDFIYIDGLHSYNAVARDIASWWPKLKPGGLFAGHDYLKFKHSESGYQWGVVEAVNEHVDKYSLELNLTRAREPIDQRIMSWYFWKHNE
jgi:SAM-dependent methyltransferase